jgi:hypothetical protein
LHFEEGFLKEERKREQKVREKRRAEKREGAYLYYGAPLGKRIHTPVAPVHRLTLHTSDGIKNMRSTLSFIIRVRE